MLHWSETTADGMVCHRKREGRIESTNEICCRRWEKKCRQNRKERVKKSLRTLGPWGRSGQWGHGSWKREKKKGVV